MRKIFVKEYFTSISIRLKQNDTQLRFYPSQIIFFGINRVGRISNKENSYFQVSIKWCHTLVANTQIYTIVYMNLTKWDSVINNTI